MKNMLGLSPVVVCVGGTRGDIYGTRGDLVVVLKVNLVIDFGYSLALAKSNKYIQFNWTPKDVKKAQINPLKINII